MKKLMIILFIIGGISLVGAENALAQQNGNQKGQTTQKVQPNQPKQGNQVNQNAQTVQTTRPRYVDADGDGVCDNYDPSQPCPGLGQGPRQGQGQARLNGNCPRMGQGMRNGGGQGLRLRDGSGPGCNGPRR